jgi:hypothetical protein
LELVDNSVATIHDFTNARLAELRNDATRFGENLETANGVEETLCDDARIARRGPSDISGDIGKILDGGRRPNDTAGRCHRVVNR